MRIEERTTEPIIFVLRFLGGLMDFPLGLFFLGGGVIAAFRFDYGITNRLIQAFLVIAGASLWTSVYFALKGHRLLAKVRASVYAVLTIVFTIDLARLVLNGQIGRYGGIPLALCVDGVFAFGFAVSAVLVFFDWKSR